MKKEFKIGIGVFVGAILIVSFLQYSNKTPPIIEVQENPINNEMPRRFLIPEIGVNTAIEEVDKDINGFLTPPKQTRNTGWYKDSVKPGENGTAVINGYVYGNGGYTSKFSDLHSMKPGDVIEVITGIETITTFVVREVKIYSLNKDLSEIFISNDKKAHLNLVTYDGIWDDESKSYSKRVVVFTDKESTTTVSARIKKLEEEKSFATPDGTALIVPSDFTNQVAELNL